MTTASLPIVSLDEWKQATVAFGLTPEDRELAAQLERDNRLSVLELRDGLRIASRSWVGLIRFQEFELNIMPKLAGESLGQLARLVEYAFELDDLKRLPRERALDATGRSLLDLLAALFATAAESVVRRGLISDYREEEDDLPVVRGRILVERQLLRRPGRPDRIECRYDERVSDIPENQLIAGAAEVCRRRVNNDAIQRRVRRLKDVFDGVCSPFGLDLSLLRPSIVMTRMNEHYRLALDLADIIVRHAGVREIYAGGAVRSFAFLLDMNKLFERFLHRWLRELLRPQSVTVGYQVKDRDTIWDLGRDRLYQSLKPDFVISRGRLRLPVDAKYKLYDEREIYSGDIYQSFIYAFACADDGGCPTALLFYPASADGPAGDRLEVRRDGEPAARIQSRGIYLPQALDEIDTRRPGPLGRELVDLIMDNLERGDASRGA